MATPTFHLFSSLPLELQLEIIKIAIQTAISHKCTKFVSHYLLRAYLEFSPDIFDFQLHGNLNVMRRYVLLGHDCLGDLLATNTLFRRQAVKYLESRLGRGKPWNSLVRNGRGQTGRQAIGNRRDVRKWRAEVYYLKCYVSLPIPSHDEVFPYGTTF